MATHNINKLSLIYDKRQKDFVVKYPLRCDGSLKMHRIINDILIWDIEKSITGENISYTKRDNFTSESLIEELGERGYDITTLKFSIELKKHH